ncbi:hypothetical protein Afil01_51930 [Actinorhabdospora filicis]|uniref:Uncharacterized protein n=1 Tax=Actinorhabdospora filicis TaxID=1785913 RepID=A0A9W6SQG5_9ACTN|nr:hypothetical protein [Actinorhabdospora filicis]GLZ80386.1 hypothetical protein Afil01_51930 [Actinorhabdospora filicis]
MGGIIMAVGKYLGPYYDWRREDSEPAYFEIHAGPKVGEFTEAQVLVWNTAHLEPSLHAAHAFDRAALEDLVRRCTPVADPAPEVDVLLREGVLVEADFADDAAVERFCRSYRLVPTADAYGNLPERREMCLLSRDGEVLMELSFPARTVWAFSYLDGSIWDGCVTCASDGADGPGYFAREIASYLPQIVAWGAGIVEPV